MSISLLENTLQAEIFYELSDASFEDNVCLCFTENCSDDERIFINEQTHIYLTLNEAKKLMAAFQAAIDEAEAKGATKTNGL